MAGAPPQQQGSGGDNALAPMWIIAFFFAVTLILWYFFHTQIVWVVFKIKLFQAYLIGLFSNKLQPIITQLEQLPPGDVGYDLMVRLSTAVGEYFRYPIMLILTILAWLLYSSDITAQYKRTYDMKTLLDAESVNWPQVIPILDLGLRDKDIDDGPWAMAVLPMAFAIKHQLLRKETQQPPPTWSKRKEPPILGIHRNEAKRVFMLQMGAYWQGVDALPPHTKALFAIFAAKANRDREPVRKMLDQINRSAKGEHLDFTGSVALQKKHISSKIVIDVINKHAYVYTLMASLLQKAREDGVLPTSEFIWLKPLDRPLWYMLNSIGRQTPFTEIAGPFSHWLVEKEFGRPCLVPQVDEAVNALEQAIREVKYRPEEGEVT